ncbi:hypothetical protein MMC28_000451 [Mycoblastus sanguinarius]|nr:hypothetical protein [Mycoblastus sanguinarius]
MANTPPQDRQVLADEFLNSISTTHNMHVTSRALPGYIYYNDSTGNLPTMPRSGDAWSRMPSPASATSPSTTYPPSMKMLTCYFWAKQGWCKWSSEQCLYAHYDTGKVANGPLQVELGRPAVAGKNASNPRPIYQDWRMEHSRAIQPEIQEQINHIKAKAQSRSPEKKTQHGFSDRNMVEATGHSTQSTIDRENSNHGGTEEETYSPPEHFKFEQGDYNMYDAPSPSYQAAHSASQPASSDSTDYELYQSIQVKNGVIKELAAAVDQAITNLEFSIDCKTAECQTLLNIAKSIPEDPTRIVDDGIMNVSKNPPFTPDKRAKLIGVIENLMHMISSDRNTIKSLQSFKMQGI